MKRIYSFEERKKALRKRTDECIEECLQCKRLINERRRKEIAKKASTGEQKKEIVKIEKQYQSEKLKFSTQLTEQGAYYWDDKMTVRAFKNNPQTKIKFPLSESWRQSSILKGVETGYYIDLRTKKMISGEEASKADDIAIQHIRPTKAYYLNHGALRWMSKDVDRESILSDIRLELKNNEFDITLTGILVARAPESRLKLIVETIRALVGAGVIKGDWNNATRTAETRPYAIFKKYFHIHEYEVRVDSGRYGARFYKTCRKKSCFVAGLKKLNRKAGGIFNQVPLYSPKKKAQRDRGFQMVVYDRAQKSENRKSKIDRNLYPFRTEVKLKRKELKDLNIQGDGEKIIQRLKGKLVSILINGVVKMKAGREFDIFVNRKRTMQSTEQTVKDLIENRSFLTRLDQLEDRTDKIEEILGYHGLTLPKRRGFKIV